MKNSTEARAARIRSTTKETARGNSDPSLRKLHNALKAAQAELKRERQARIQAEKALIKTKGKQADNPLEAERNPQSQIKRISFVVRLTLDEQGQFERTEIEHVSSNRKQNFLSLDGDLLVAFIKACINPEITPENVISTKPL